MIKRFIKDCSNVSNLKTLLVIMCITAWLSNNHGNVISNTLISGVSYIIFCFILWIIVYTNVLLENMNGHIILNFCMSKFLNLRD